MQREFVVILVLFLAGNPSECIPSWQKSKSVVVTSLCLNDRLTRDNLQERACAGCSNTKCLLLTACFSHILSAMFKWPTAALNLFSGPSGVMMR